MRLCTTALAAIVLTTTPALAAPWNAWSGEIGGETIFQAYQSDPSTGYELNYSCNPSTGAEQITITGAERFDAGADYAPEVPVVLQVDTTAIDYVDFRFEAARGYLTVKASAEGQSGNFDGLIDALSLAQASIAIAYFDKSMSFSAEGAKEAIESTRSGCGV